MRLIPLFQRSGCCCFSLITYIVKTAVTPYLPVRYFDRKKRIAKRDAMRGSRRILGRSISLRWYMYTGGTLRGKVKFSQDAGKRAQKESFGRRCGCGEKGRNYVKSLENLSEHFLNSAFARLAYYFYGSRERTESASERKRESNALATLLYIGLERGWVWGAYQICW